MKKIYMIAGLIGIMTLGACALRTPESAAPSDTLSDADRPANAYYLFSKAYMHLKEKEVDQAIGLMLKAATLDPESTFLKRELAEVWLAQKDFLLARTALESVVEKEPNDVAALILLGRIYQVTDEPERARATFSRAIAIDPDQENIYLLLGGLYMEQEQWEGARDNYLALVKRFPSAYAGYFYLGRIAAVNGDYAAAERYFKKALSIEPRFLEARFELAGVYESRRRYKSAIAVYREILSLHPDHPHAMMALGYAQYRHGETRLAAARFAELGERSLSNDDVLRTLVQVYFENRNYEAALVILQGMYQRVPENAVLLYLIGVALDGVGKERAAIDWLTQVPPDSRFFKNAFIHAALLYQELNLPDRAIALMQEAMIKAPQDSEIRFYLAAFYEQTEDYENAEQTLRAGLENDPENPQLYFRLGVVYDKWDRKQDSIKAMKQVIELDPEDAGALNYLGYTYAEKGIHLDEAETLIRKALTLKPNDGYITDSLGWVYYQRGQYEQALLFLEEAVRLVQDDPVILEHLGDVYEKLGRATDARRTYRQAIEAGHTDTDGIEKKILELVTP